MNTPEIVAFVRTGEIREAKAGEWLLDANGLYCSGGCAARLPIFLPIPATHPKAADILALVPKPKTLGERVRDEIKAEYARHGQHLAAQEIGRIIDRLAAEGK